MQKVWRQVAAGTVLASGGEDGNVRLWNPVDGKETASIGAHGAKVTSLVFAPTGAQLVDPSRLTLGGPSERI